MAAEGVITLGIGAAPGSIGPFILLGLVSGHAGTPVTGPLSVTLASSGKTQAVLSGDGSTTLTLANSGKTQAEVS